MPIVEDQFVLAQKVHEGPLPPPETLKAYEKVLPGAAREILEMAKEHQSHIVWMDREGVRQAFWQLILSFVLGLVGQIGSLLITLSGFYMAYLYIKAGEPRLGYAVAVAAMGVCGYLIWWKTRQKDD